MRIALLVALIGAACCAPSGVGDAFGAWKVNPLRSEEPHSPSLFVRFEPHTKGEVFTLDRIEADGRTVTSSTILYFDGKSRDFEDQGCSGTQSSRRVDSRTVEILRRCASGEWIRFIRRFSRHPRELVLEVAEQQPGGRRLERRLVLERR